MKQNSIARESHQSDTSAVPAQKPHKRILRIQEVEARVGFKRSYIYRLIRQNKFPQRIRLGIRAVGWDSEKIDAWIEEHLNTSIS